MDFVMFDPLNPYFKHEVDKLCAVCSKKLEKGKTHSLNTNVDKETIKVYQVLESISKFKLSEDGPQLLCFPCYHNTASAYKFQQICNNSQGFYEQYMKHQQILVEQKKSDDKTEEIEIQISPPNEQQDINKEKKAVKACARRIQCKVCHTFHRADNLKAHMRIHTGEKPYKCKLCDASFTQWSSLKYHTEAHENKRHYVCRFCGKAYNTNSQVRQHEMTHTGERPHQCKQCDLSFRTKQDFRRHSVVHTDEKPFTCEYCAKSYNRNSTLRVHLKIHTGEKSHECEWCGKRFIQLSSLKSHLQTHAKKHIQEAVKEQSMHDIHTEEIVLQISEDDSMTETYVIEEFS